MRHVHGSVRKQETQWRKSLLLTFIYTSMFPGDMDNSVYNILAQDVHFGLNILPVDTLAVDALASIIILGGLRFRVYR